MSFLFLTNQIFSLTSVFGLFFVRQLPTFFNIKFYPFEIYHTRLFSYLDCAHPWLVGEHNPLSSKKVSHSKLKKGRWDISIKKTCQVSTFYFISLLKNTPKSDSGVVSLHSLLSKHIPHTYTKKSTVQILHLTYAKLIFDLTFAINIWGTSPKEYNFFQTLYLKLHCFQTLDLKPSSFRTLHWSDWWFLFCHGHLFLVLYYFICTFDL